MKKYLIVLSLIIVSFILGMYSKPAEVKIKEVEKIVTVVKEVKKDNTKIVQKEVITQDKDGNIKIIRDYKEDRSIDESKQSETKSEKVSEKTSKNLPNNFISLSRQFSNPNQLDQSFNITYQRRLFSSFYVGGYVSPSKNLGYGLSITLGF